MAGWLACAIGRAGVAAIVTLSEWRDEASRSPFEQAAASSVVRLQRAGKAALERLEKAK